MDKMAGEGGVKSVLGSSEGTVSSGLSKFSHNREPDPTKHQFHTDPGSHVCVMRVLFFFP